MPHINTAPGEHDPTVSAYIVRLDSPQPSLMLHMHRKLHRYLQYGGHIERKENPWQAITHELLEESGYDITQLRVLQPRQRLSQLTGTVMHPYPVCYLTHAFPGLDHYHTDTAFAFVTDAPPLDTVHDGESEDHRLFTALELRQLPGDQIYENVREIGLFVLEQCLPDWDAVHWPTEHR